MMDKLKPCPKCGDIPLMGYACGEFFIFSANETLNQCPCSSFFEMHPMEEQEIEAWNRYVDKLQSEKEGK